MRVLNAHTVQQAVDMPAAIAAVREGFTALSTGEATVPLRSALETERGVTLYMPAYLSGAPFSSVKVVSVYPENPARGLPTINAAVLVLDAETGQPLALLDGTYLTALRTGAASGLATDLLARPDAKTLGVIGAGAQARTQIEAVCAVRSIQSIRLYSLSGAEELARKLRERCPAAVTVAASGREALQEADVIVAATNSKKPVVHAADVMTSARIVVDHRESAWAEAGDLIIPRAAGLLSEDDIHAEIGEVAAGLAPGRTSPEEVTVFKSVGNAVQDAAVAGAILAVAAAHDLGVTVDL